MLAADPLGEETQRISTLALPEPGFQVPASEGTSPKALGAYYTDAEVAGFLLRWAVVTGRELVLDPSFGGGVFLTSAIERIRHLGGDPSRQVWGVDLDSAAFRAFHSSKAAGSVAGLLESDFFELPIERFPHVDAV